MAKLFPYAFFQEFDDQGDPLAGGKLYSYEAGTSTPKTTYSDSDGATPNANPVVFDSYGRANVWLGDGSYKFILKDADDNTIYTVDNIGGDSAAAFGSTVSEISGNLSVTEVYANAVITATAAATLSLLPAATAGEGFYFVVKNAHASASVTLDPDLSETIDGAATVTIGPGQSALVITNGTDWRTMFLATVSATGNNTLSGSNTFTGKVLLPTDGELTIATGAVTVTGAFHTIDTESDAASDNLDTISGGADGQVLQIRADNDARTVVVKHNTGNIYNPGAADISLDNYYNVLNLRYDGTLTKWVVINNTASETVPGNVELATTAEAAAGTDTTRAVTPAGLQLLGYAYTQSSATDSTATTIPHDNTIPQNTEGKEFFTVAYTPKKATSKIHVRVVLHVSTSAAQYAQAALFKDSTADAIAADSRWCGQNGEDEVIAIDYFETSGGTSTVTYKLRFGCDGGTMYVNRTNTGAIFGGVLYSQIEVFEYNA
jgi:hypothetical protein